MNPPDKLNHSYDFDHYSELHKKEELKRLYFQATIFKQIETDHLMQLGVDSCKTVLEVGCGAGFVSGLLADIVRHGDVHGLDSSQSLLDVANKIVKPVHPNVAFYLADACCTGRPDACYDFVYSRMLYQHLSDPLAALREARRVTKQDGRVCVVDVDDDWVMMYPDCPSFTKLNQLSSEFQKNNLGDRRIGKKLPYLMQEAGFSKVRLDVKTVSSFDIDPKLFLDITVKFKAAHTQCGEAQKLIGDIYSFVTEAKHKVLVAASVFVVTGTV
ncbi:MAG: methyltransferase domain-containing protein [Deltaproteobacteria bacterium]|nr:methyltransferase domain-containing protein [Deltaproteobacteria bacterium]